MFFSLASDESKKIRIFPYEFGEIDLQNYIEIPLMNRSDPKPVSAKFRFFISNEPGEYVDDSKKFNFEYMSILKPIVTKNKNLRNNQSRLSLFRFANKLGTIDEFELYIPIFASYDSYPVSLPPPQGRMGVKEIFENKNVSLLLKDSQASSFFGTGMHHLHVEFEFGPILEITIFLEGARKLRKIDFTHKHSDLEHCLYWLRNELVRNFWGQKD